MARREIFGFEMLDLAPRMCRFPVQDNPYLFCGDETPPHSSWCEAHAKRVFQQKPVKVGESVS